MIRLGDAELELFYLTANISQLESEPEALRMFLYEHRFMIAEYLWQLKELQN